MHFIMMTLGIIKGASLTDAFPGLIKFSQLRNKKTRVVEFHVT